MSEPMPAGIRLESFSGAQLTLVWSLPALPKSEPKHLYLLWATVELFPKEVPGPVSERWTRDASFLLRGEPSERLFLARVTVSPADGLAWFARLATAGAWTIPDCKTHQLSGTPDGEEPVGDRLVEPPWPELTLVPSDGRFGAIPLDLQDALVSSVLPSTSRAMCSWAHASREAASAWIEDRTGVAVGADAQIWGSAHLIVWNPVIRRCHLTLDANEDGATRGVLARTVLREGESYKDLALTVLERRDKGWRLLYDGPATGPCLTIPVVGEPSEVATLLRRDGQLLHISGPHFFVRTIELAMTAVGGRRQVTMQDGVSGSERTYTVPLHGKPERTRIGTEPPRDGVQVLRNIRRRIDSARSAARPDEQVWIRGNRDAALERLRGLLATAERRLLFVDPYFGCRELAEFVAAVPNQAAIIQVLGSADGLRLPDGLGGTRRSLAESLHALAETRKDVCTGAKVQPVAIRLMCPPGIHDRFLVCDQTIYLLGSSLNSFGTSGTMFVKLPHPEHVLPELEAEWDKSPTLEDRLREAKPAGGAEE